VKSLNCGLAAAVSTAGRLSPLPGFAITSSMSSPNRSAGTDEAGNLALACPTCNYYKSNHLLGLDEDGMAGRPLFNPRKDRWEEHFEFDAAAFHLRGKTPEARGTINRLRMNQAIQIEARRLWMELEIYP
jgi:hypothetical protein